MTFRSTSQAGVVTVPISDPLIEPQFPPGSPTHACVTHPLRFYGSLASLTAALCLVSGVFLDGPVARMALSAPAGVHIAAQAFSSFGLSGYMLVISGLIAAGAFAALRFDIWNTAAPALRLIGERALFVLAAVGLSGILVQVFKHLIGRARPKTLETLGAFHFDMFSIKASLASFPSGHSTSIFALATALALIMPRLRFVLFAFAIVVAAARAVLGTHYVSDVLAGASLGTGFTLWLAVMMTGRSIAFTERAGRLQCKGQGTVFPAIRSLLGGVRAPS